MKKIIFAAMFLLIAASAHSQNISDYLILDDIGIYTYKSERSNIGEGSGIVGLAGHFDRDHVDTVCTGRYSNINQLRGLPHEEIRQKLVSVEVQITEHAGADSDRWLLHEVEDSYRGDDTLNETVDTNVQIRTIDGNNIYFIGIYGGKSYTWISDNKVVDISCSSCPNTKPEPIEVVKAYLAKHPSTITMTDEEAKGRAHNEAWIKDEMERRLWLGDRWFTALQLEKAELGDVLREAVGHMGVFLDYREKYYGISGDEEKARLSEFLREQNGTGIKNRLDALKSWWADNKDDGIDL